MAGRLRAAELTGKRTTAEAREQTGALVDHSSFAKFMQLLGQSWSVIEYLTGTGAPGDRVGRFRSFLSDLKRNAPEEEVFVRHFGHGYDALLRDWQAWVEQQDTGNDTIPPREIGSAITLRLLPAIRDRSKRAQDRIQAIRSLGMAGYVVGAQALIDVLHEGDDRLTQSAIWALEAISGHCYGSDLSRWSQWWKSRDPKTVSEFELAEQV